VCIGVILPSQTAVSRELVEIGHVGVADDIVVALVLLDHDEDVLDLGYYRRGALARCLGRLGATETQDEDDEGGRPKVDEPHLADASLPAQL
jgi:hypothetical protein